MRTCNTAMHRGCHICGDMLRQVVVGWSMVIALQRLRRAFYSEFTR